MNNMSISSLDFLLTKETALERYYWLIPMKPDIISRLEAAGIRDSDALEKEGTRLAALFEKTRLPEEQLKGVLAFFRFHRFRPRPIREFAGIDPAYTNALLADGVKDSGAYLRKYALLGAKAMGEQYGADPALAKKFACLCDLMRIGGVRLIRATLYYDLGYTTVQSLANQPWERIQREAADYIRKNGIAKIAPLKKELQTTAALSAALPPMPEHE